MRYYNFITFILLFYFHPVFSIQQNLVPGGIAIIPVDNINSDVRYHGRRVLVIKPPAPNGATPFTKGGDNLNCTKVSNNLPFCKGEKSAKPTEGFFIAIIGIDLLSNPGTKQEIIIDNKYKKYFEIKPANYNISRINIKNKKLVDLPKEYYERLKNDNKKIISKLNIFDNNFYPHDLNFKQPTAGTPSSSFGSKRIINGKDRNPHKGMDIAAPIGTKVYSTAPGKVSAVLPNLLLSGNTIIIEHGRGLKTMYCHLNKILIKEGAIVDQDTVIGTVGKTGRATGAHLHFAVSLNQARVNPQIFLD